MPERIIANDQQSRTDRLFIKVIMPKQGTERPVPTGGNKPVPFREVNQPFRSSLSRQVDAIKTTISLAEKRVGAVPVRVRLLPEALAKTHRPNSLFSSETCPIIGAGKPGELFVRATTAGIQELNQIINTGDSQKIIKEISSIRNIEPITPNDRRGGRSSSEILRSAPRSTAGNNAGFVMKVQLFDIGPGQGMLEGDFIKQCSESNIAVNQRAYTLASRYYEVTCRSDKDVEFLSKIVGVRSIREMPVLSTIRSQARVSRELPNNLPLPDGDLRQYPTIAIVDSGIRDDIPELDAWIVDRESTVAPVYRNTDHGTFVAGLVAFAANLNPSIPGIDPTPCAIFDFQVIPNGDPDRGDVDILLESELLQSLEDLLKRYANDVKVWNLSLGTDERCSLDEFSSFAVELDRLQEEYAVSFVLSAGNYDTRPLLSYPRTADQVDQGRITTPADSVLGIAVGSVAHMDHSDTGPLTGEPSPFSRHGAGPNYIIKPDLVHCGGTCRPDGTQQIGVESFVSKTALGGNCGTSFSTPLVSRVLASIYHHITPTPSRELARAVLTHHARDPRSGLRVPDTEENYLGFGRPTPTPICLECEPWMSTLVFEDTLRPGYNLEWDNFPYPPSLIRDGRFFGHIWMTLAFAPARGASWGSEYCETHIDAHFGVYKDRRNRKTGATTSEFEGLVPPEHKNQGLLYESYQVEKLRKWAPVRTYFGDLGETGKAGTRWRLMLRLLSRHGVETPEIRRPQPFALILTIADPLRTEPIYNEMAISIGSRFRTTNLTVRNTARVRTRG